MLKKTPVIISLLVLSLVAFLVYQQVKTPDGVVAMSEQAETTALISLWASIISLIVALMGLVERIISLRKRDD